VRPLGFEPRTCGLRAGPEACLEGYRDDLKASDQVLSIERNSRLLSEGVQLLGFLLGWNFGWRRVERHRKCRRPTSRESVGPG
jgi:hypothetical protein